MDSAEIYAITLDEIHDEFAFTTLLNAAPPDVREKAQRYVFFADQARCLLADALVRLSISNATGIKPDRVSYEYGAMDKPRFADINGWFFNKAHSGQWVLVGLSKYEIGVDVEQVDEPTLPLAKYAFHPKEYRVYERSGKKSDFYRFWTLKESYIKYLGVGLSMALDSFYFTVSSRAIKLHHERSRRDFDGLASADYAGRSPNFFTFNPDDEHFAAVCTDAPNIGSIRRVRLSDIFDNIKKPQT